MWEENAKRPNQRIKRKGLEVIVEAVDELLNNTQPSEQRTAELVRNADTALFQVTNTNSVV